MKRGDNHVVLIDFGSTYTKVAVADRQHKRLVHTAQFPSTVATDARLGLEQCFHSARQAIGEQAFSDSLKLASSSAAGGLRMGVIGLSRTLSIAAGRNAAFGAGAKILKTCAGRLSEDDVRELAELSLEILLFCGGYENGNVSVLEHNADMLAKSNIHVPIIFAGNSQVSPYIRRVFTLSGKEFYIVRNIVPNVGELDKQPVEAIIREIFLKRIINMKNLDKVSDMLDRMVMPTPVAVLNAGALLSTGCQNHEGFGPTMIVDVGGATTDVYSYVDQVAYEGAKVIGVKESYAKRSVEGDLGMRESSNSLIEEIGREQIAQETALPEQAIMSVIEHWLADHDLLAQSEQEQRVDHALTCGAVRIASRRHAGWIERISSAGIKEVQHGKNLTEVKQIIGTGGPIVFSASPRSILAQSLRDKQAEPDTLLPENARFFIDESYVFFAAGLLAEVDEETAFLLMKTSLCEI